MATTRRVPTYSPHLVLQAAGDIGPVGSAWEQFSYSLRIRLNNASLPTQEQWADMAADVKAFHGRVGSQIGKQARLTSIKGAQVQPDGKWRNGQPEYREVCNVAGGADSGPTFLTQAPQVAMAVTLRTAMGGPRGRGRFYLPLPIAVPSATTGLINAVDAAAVAESVAQLIDGLQNLVGQDLADPRVVVASTYGSLSNVTRVDVGRRLDVIRSRATSVQEAYVSHGLAVAQ